MKRTMRRVALSTAGALGLGLLFWAKANAVDIKGSVRSDETPKDTGIEAVRFVLEPHGISVDTLGEPQR